MSARDGLWSGVLVVAGATMGLVLVCIAPFVAVATLAARTLPRRIAFAAIGAMWVANQAIGFGWSHYPRDASTFAWGAAMLAASLAAGFVATRVRATAFAFLAAFATFELVLFAWSLVVGERGSFSARIVAQIFAGNLFGIAVLGVLRLAMLATGVSTLASKQRAVR
jgi:hypothetical protein